MTQPKPFAAFLLASAVFLFSSAGLLAFTGCRTTVVQPVKRVDVPVPAPQHYDDHHDDHQDDHQPPPPPDHRDDHR